MHFLKIFALLCREFPILPNRKGVLLDSDLVTGKTTEIMVTFIKAVLRQILLGDIVHHHTETVN